MSADTSTSPQWPADGDEVYLSRVGYPAAEGNLPPEPEPDDEQDEEQETDLEVILANEMADRIEVLGHPCRVKRIRTKELMLAASILTASMGDVFANVKFDELDQEQGIAMFLTAIPEASDEFVELIRAVIEPVDKLSAEELQKMDMELRNPPVDLTLDVVPVLVAQEWDTFQSLWGKARRLFTALAAGIKAKQKAKKKTS